MSNSQAAAITALNTSLEQTNVDNSLTDQVIRGALTVGIQGWHVALNDGAIDLENLSEELLTVSAHFKELSEKIQDIVNSQSN